MSEGTIQTVQVGMGWFGEQPGGLSRFFHDLLHALPTVGVAVRGVVVGSQRASLESHGVTTGVAGCDAAIWRRWIAINQVVSETLLKQSGAILVTHFALYAMPVLRHTKRHPFVVHFHGPWALEAKVEGASVVGVMLRRRVERMVYSKARRCIVLSTAFADLLHTEYGVPIERIRIIPGAVDNERFASSHSKSEARDALGWPTSRPIVLAVRRLVRRMGLESLIVAAKLAQEKVPDILVLVAGRGPLQRELVERISVAGLQEHVKLLGFVPDNLLPLAYRAADISVVPTASLEGFGLSVAESLAAGTPALVTPVGALPEVVSDLSPALVLQGVSPEDIAAGLVTALTNPSLLPTSDACRHFARERYNWQRVASMVRDVYAEVAE